MLAFQIKQRRNTGRLHDIVLVAEGVGNIFEVEKQLKEKVTTEVRTVILGHVQRGGTPSGRDRMLATQMAVKAVETLEAGEGGVMIGIERGDLVAHPISYAWEGTKRNNILDLYRIADIFSR